MTVPLRDYPTEKICPHPSCPLLKAPQPIENFARDAGRRDGRNANCKDCTRRKNKEWRSKNVEYMRQKNKEWYQANSDKAKASVKQYRLDHPEWNKRTKKLYRDRNPERFRAYSRAKRQRHLAQYNENARVYHLKTKVARWAMRHVCECRIRARKKGLAFSISSFDLMDSTGKLPEFCPVLPSIRLDYAAGPERRKWASVDRIIPSLGYVPGNVRVISMCANLAKMDGIGDLI
jgi:hypothetical protein